MDRQPAQGRRLATSALVLAALVAAGCGDADPDVEDSAVALSVPDGWSRSDPEVTADVVESRRWLPERDDGSSLQVVVGCGDATSAEDLVEGAATGERPLPVVGGVEEPAPVEVDGLDDAMRVTFGLGSSPDDVRLWMGGLYGVGDGVLVLVELVRPRARFSEDAADDVLGSVRVDTSVAAEHCEGRAD